MDGTTLTTYLLFALLPVRVASLLSVSMSIVPAPPFVSMSTVIVKSVLQSLQNYIQQLN